MTNVAPAVQAPTTTPSQDDRLLAACSHLSFLVGFPVLAPIAIYAIKRKQSRFVGFHALQAAVAHALFGMAMMLGFFVFWVVMAITIVGAAEAGSRLGGLMMPLPIVGFFLVGFALFAVQVYAAYAAWLGESWSIPIAGRIARAIQNADEGAAKA